MCVKYQHEQVSAQGHRHGPIQVWVVVLIVSLVAQVIRIDHRNQAWVVVSLHTTTLAATITHPGISFYFLWSLFVAILKWTQEHYVTIARARHFKLSLNHFIFYVDGSKIYSSFVRMICLTRWIKMMYALYMSLEPSSHCYMVLGWYFLVMKRIHLVFFRLYASIDNKYSPIEHGIRAEGSIRKWMYC